MSDCLFCGIINGNVKGEIVYQDSSVVAFKDINPKAPVHLLIVPRRHIGTLLDVNREDKGLMGDVLCAAAQLARDHGISEEGFRVVVNCGAGAGQSVFHIHFHLLGGRPLRWPPG
ncbi:MAG: histidine triad nucleotide-binding protein [Candidatus Binatia bacterium]